MTTIGWKLADIARLEPDESVSLSIGDFRSIGQTLDAFWEDLGAPGSLPYHGIMVSRLHTNGFVNCSTYLAWTNLCQILAGEVIDRLEFEPGNVDIVVGPGNAAITLSYEIARQLQCRHGFTEKGQDGKPTKFGGRTQIQPGERVLIVNELMSTQDGSTLQCKEGVLAHQPEARVLPVAGVLVNRSGAGQLSDGTLVASVYDFDMQTWTPEECPHCKAGSIPIKPKLTRENWLKLTGRVV